MRHMVFLPSWVMCSVLCLGSIFQMGCVREVRLPSAPAFPTSEALRQLDTTPAHKAARAKLLKWSPMLWRELEVLWGVKKIYGRIYLHVAIKKGRVALCQLRRSEIKVGQLLNRQALRLHRRELHRRMFRRFKSKTPDRGLCVLLKKQAWPQTSEPIALGFLMVRER